MFTKLLESVFGCWHRNYSFPMTIKPGRNSAAQRSRGTYVVCLACGRELAYDWNKMKVSGSTGAAHWSGVQELVAP